MMINKSEAMVAGYSSDAYAERSAGQSPDYIRDAIWNLVVHDISGVVLDTGSGDGGWIKRLQTLPAIDKIISVDIADDGASQLPQVEFYLADLSLAELPCADESVDWLFSTEVVEHLANPRHFFKEAERCLKPGGRLVISTPYNESFRAKLYFLLRGYYPEFSEYTYQLAGHITPILKVDLNRMAREVGFESVDFSYTSMGRIPGSQAYWQNFLPFLKGKFWSDNMIAIMVK